MCSKEGCIADLARLQLSQQTQQSVTRQLHQTASRPRPAEELVSSTSSVGVPLEAVLSTAAKPSDGHIPVSVAQQELQSIRLPRAVQATYLTPLRRKALHETPVCDLQLRSYSIRNLEAFADFALRAAYYLNLPAKGPVPLPRITERWTVPRSNFIFKKSQENFERITLRRLIQIQDGHAETVAIWLGFLQKYSYYGIGMKANVFEHSGLNVAKDMDREAERIEEVLGMNVGAVRGRTEKEREVLRKLKLRGGKFATSMFEESFKSAYGANAPMSAVQSAKAANDTFPAVSLADAAGEGGEDTEAFPADQWELAQELSRPREVNMALPVEFQNLPRLTSAAERRQLKEQGRCLRCREHGHSAIDEVCPLYHVSPPERKPEEKKASPGMRRDPYTLPQEFQKLGKLKKSEKTALRKEGKCIRCRQPGHAAGDEACPLQHLSKDA
nr:37s ribosomal protein s10, mitochondrial [Quercus suber]